MTRQRDKMQPCKVCDNASGNRIHRAREMMFGFRDEFEYMECAECGCLQIRDIPEDLDKYYPDAFYAFRRKNKRAIGSLKRFFERKRASYCLHGKNRILGLRSRSYGNYEWFKRTEVDFDSKILDVGCGIGNLLLKMEVDGFSNLTGIDPFIDGDITYSSGLKVYKKNIFEVDDLFDLVMMHHSFEHMPEPLSVFTQLYKILKNDSYALVRIPIADSFAWKYYGINWVQLDAPRHFFLHTTKSIETLAFKVGLEVKDIVFDSGRMQIWGSELYAQDIPLVKSDNLRKNKSHPIFKKNRMNEYKLQSEKLNKNKEGDSACFYLYKA